MKKMTAAIRGATNSSPTENTSLVESCHANICNKIQSPNMNSPAVPVAYVHPLVRRSTMWMSQKSLQMCTESLGSETGSNDFDDKWFSMSSPQVTKDMTGQQEGHNKGRTELLSSVNHDSTVRSPPRSFPPPLPSISHRDGSCIQMRHHRIDGRLVVTAIPVPPQKYLHAHRHEGRLVLSFIHTTSYQSCSTCITSNEPLAQPKYSNYNQQVTEPEYVKSGDEDEEQVEDEEEEEEEVEVLDRGTIVEVKVSSQPQQQRGAVKILRSSIVINKFVGGAPQSNENRSPEPTTLLPQRRMVPTTTPAVAAAVAASSVSATPEVAWLGLPFTENKLLFTSKRRNREEMLYNMRRCIELRRPLFIWEQCCIATT